MVQSASFLSLLRKRKIPPPTARDFDLCQWEAALEAFGVADAPLIEAGIWFGRELQARWTQIEALGLEATSIGVLSRHVAGVANIMHLRSGAMLQVAAMKADPQTASAGSMAQMKIGDEGDASTADMMRTSVIDALGKFAGYVRTTVAKGAGTDRLDPEVFNKALPLFEDIYLLDYLWGRFAWCGWRMKASDGEIEFLRPEPDPVGDSFVVAEFRREMLLAEFYAIYAMEWSHAQSVLPPAWTVKVRKRDNLFSFSASQRKAGEGEVSSTYVLRQVLEATELAPYLDAALPRLGEPIISLNDLLTAWELLAMATDGLAEHFYAKSPQAPPLTFAPSLRLADLHRLLEPLGWSLEKRQAVIGFFVYEHQAFDGLWSKPLLPIGGGRVVPVLTPLSAPNLLRTAELWITEGAGEGFFTKRGTEAEAKLRSDIIEAMASRAWRGSARVLQSEWVPKIDGVKRDIDLAVRLGDTVFIGELKLKKYPVSAAEIGRHIDEFDHAADQLGIRLAWLNQNRPLLAQQMGFEGAPETLKLRGFVISGTAFGSGGRAGGFPVIDRDALLFFFEQDAFMVSATARRETGYEGEALKPSLALRLVDGDLAAAFLAYLRNPLHVRLIDTAVVVDRRVNKLKATGVTISWDEPHVDGAKLGPHRADGLAKRLGEFWRRQVADAREELSDPTPCSP